VVGQAAAICGYFVDKIVLGQARFRWCGGLALKNMDDVGAKGPAE